MKKLSLLLALLIATSCMGAYQSPDNVGKGMTSVGANAIAATMTSTGTTSIAGTMTAANAQTIATTMGATGANTIGSAMTSTGANAVAATRTRATGSTVAVGGVAVSSSSGLSQTTSSSFSALTNPISVTITTSGRPVFVGLMSDGSSGTNYCELVATNNSSGNVGNALYRILRGASIIAATAVTITATEITNTLINTSPCAGFNVIDFPSAGTYTYTVQYAASAGAAEVIYAALVAYEL